MPFEIKHDTEYDYIRVTFTGKLTMPLTREYITALLPILEETDCRRLLSDCRNATVHLSARDIMLLPKMAADWPKIVRLKRAVLATPRTSGYELYKTFSMLLGQQLRVFSDQEEAMEWLMATPAEK